MRGHHAWILVREQSYSTLWSAWGSTVPLYISDLIQRKMGCGYVGFYMNLTNPNDVMPHGMYQRDWRYCVLGALLWIGDGGDTNIIYVFGFFMLLILNSNVLSLFRIRRHCWFYVWCRAFQNGAPCRNQNVLTSMSKCYLEILVGAIVT